MNVVKLFSFVAVVLLMLPVYQASAETETIRADQRYLYVQPGQTLHNIVKRLYPERHDDWGRIKQAIIKLNPHAFIDGKASQLKANIRLELPHTSVIKPVKALQLKHVGDVIQARGSVVAVGTDKSTRKLTAGKKLFVGDKLITGEDGFVRMRMIDNALLDLRCYSIMVIEDYAIRSATRRSVIKLLQGSLRKITGEIGKFKDDVYEMSTPAASVGVRGTEYALRVFQSKGCDGTVDTEDEGLFLDVINGMVKVENKQGEVVVAQGDQVYVPLPEKKQPPVKKKIKAGVIQPVLPQQEAEDSNIWWWVLGVVVIAVAL